MKAISEQHFFRKFMEISTELTIAELRMLYLLINEPAVAKLNQQEFAEKIQANRRTVNIGLKKLRQLNYISDDYSKKNGINNETEDDPLMKSEVETAKKVIENSFFDYFKSTKKKIIINEDYFSFILGDIRLPFTLRQNEKFVRKTLREKFPHIVFYTELNSSDYVPEIDYYIVSLVNSEIKKARNIRKYRINTDELISNAVNNRALDEDKVVGIIKKYFTKTRITDNYISLRKPYKAKQFE